MNLLRKNLGRKELVTLSMKELWNRPLKYKQNVLDKAKILLHQR